MNKKTAQYIREYKWGNIFAMIRNNLKDAKICRDDFRGKLVAISGATSGIGYLAARKYASQGANLLCINRNPEKSEKLRLEIESEFGVKCDYKIADLSRLDEVSQLSSSWRRPRLPSMYSSTTRVFS